MSCSVDGGTGYSLHILAMMVSTSPLLTSFSSSLGDDMQLREVEALLLSLFRKHGGSVGGEAPTTIPRRVGTTVYN